MRERLLDIPQKDHAWVKGRTSFGGEAAEALVGNNDHSGSGSDRGHARFIASILNPNNGGSVLSQQRFDAYSAVASVGAGFLSSSAWHLAMEGVAA